MKGLPPVLITAIVLVAGFALCAVQFPNIASTRVVGNLLTDNAFLGIVATGMTFVIISGGIDLSVGSIYALAGVTMAMVLRATGSSSPTGTFLLGLAVAVGIGLICGALNGLMVVVLRVHPFIVTLGTMWILRGVAFVASSAESILVPGALTDVAKASLGLSSSLYPVPILTMIVVTAVGDLWLYLKNRALLEQTVGEHEENY